jgi:hypothetical protein
MAVTELILDYSKWRAGGSGINKVGEGVTALLNNNGFMCCIGQFCEQTGVSRDRLRGRGEPDEINGFEDGLFVYKNPFGLVYNTDLSTKLIEINDDPETTAEYKIEKISRLLAGNGIELKVINKPKNDAPATEGTQHMLDPNVKQPEQEAGAEAGSTGEQ